MSDEWTPELSLRRSRFSGVAFMILIVTMPFGVMLWLGREWVSSELSESQKQIAILSAFIGLLCVAAGFISRSQCWKKGWQENVIVPKAYWKGVFGWQLGVFGAMLAVAMACMVSGHAAPIMAAVPVAMILMMVGWPDGSPMHKGHE